MRVKCILCDSVENINSDSLIARRLRKGRTPAYTCEECNTRIEKKTKARIATGNFKLYREEPKEKHL